MNWSKLLARVFKIDVTRCTTCLKRLNPDQWERVDTKPHIALMLIALKIEPHPPPMTPAGHAGKLTPSFSLFEASGLLSPYPLRMMTQQRSGN